MSAQSGTTNYEPATPKLPSAPYPGLRPFESAEWPVFFGRECVTNDIIGRLVENPLILIHGSSGCGKSSLVRAGVLVQLAQQHARLGTRWSAAIMRPAASPLRELAAAMVRIDRQPRTNSDPERVLAFRRIFNRGPNALPELAKELECSPTNHVCVVIDQFEELFRFARDVSPDEARLFGDLLVAIGSARPAGLYVIVTMRSDFVGQCADIRGFAETFNHSQYLLPHMERFDLIQAICEPAKLYGGSVSPELAERLIADARSSVDPLPLIQHALMRLWMRSGTLTAMRVAESALRSDKYTGGPRLEAAEYEPGGLSKLLSDHADEVMDGVTGDDPNKRRIVQELFRALTDTNSDRNAIRRPRPFNELRDVTGAEDSTLRSILDAFRKDGVSFIAPFGTEMIADDDTIDISHEALMRSWTRLAGDREGYRGWLQREFDDGLVWRTLLSQATRYEQAAPEEESSDHLLSPALLEERERWLQHRNEAWSRRYGGEVGDWKSVAQYIRASRAKVRADRERRESELRKRAKLRQRRALFIILGLVGLASILGVGWYAQEGRREARLTWATMIAMKLIQAAEIQQWRANPDLAVRYSLRAVDLLQLPELKSRGVTVASAEYVLRRALATRSIRTRDPVSAIGFEESGDLLLGHSGGIEIWCGAELVRSVAIVEPGRVESRVILFSQRGRVAVTARASGGGGVWTFPESGSELDLDLPPSVGTVLTAAFSPNERWLTILTQGGAHERAIYVVDMTRRVGPMLVEVPRLDWGGVFVTNEGGVTQFESGAPPVVYSPDGEHMVSNGYGGRLVLSQANGKGKPVRVLSNPPRPDGRALSGRAFSLDGSRFAAFADDGQIHVWELGDQYSTGELQQFGEASSSRLLAFDGHIDRVACVTRAGLVLLRDLRKYDDLFASAGHALDGRGGPLTAAELDDAVGDLIPALRKGVMAAREGHILDAVAQFREAESYPGVEMGDETWEANRIAASAKWTREIAAAGDAADRGNLVELDARLAEARMIDPEMTSRVESELRFQDRVYSERIAQGLDDARNGDIDHAIAIFDDLTQRGAKLNSDALSTICWRGSVLGHAKKVLEYGNRAVALSTRDMDFPSQVTARDARGLALALTGDVPAAIEDFSFVLQRSVGPGADARRRWIMQLRDGRNPFTPEVLSSLSR